MQQSYSLPELSFSMSPIMAFPTALRPQDILAILDSLEKADNDVLCQVQRVKEEIKEARAQIDSYRARLKTKNKENRAELAMEKQQTRADFWMNM
jgi:hypothetical protein